MVRRKARCRRGQTEQHENRTFARYCRSSNVMPIAPNLRHLTDITMLSDDENGPIGLTDVVVVDALRPALSACPRRTATFLLATARH